MAVLVWTYQNVTSWIEPWSNMFLFVKMENELLSSYAFLLRRSLKIYEYNAKYTYALSEFLFFSAKPDLAIGVIGGIFHDNYL